MADKTHDAWERFKAMAGDLAVIWSVNDPEEMGECDTCGRPYELASRDGRCGDCGDCGQCCNH